MNQLQARAQERQPLARDRTRAAGEDDHQLAPRRLGTDDDRARPSERIQRFLDDSVDDRLSFRAEVADALEGDGHFCRAMIPRFGRQCLQSGLKTELERWGWQSDVER